MSDEMSDGMSEGLKLLNELTERLPEVPDSLPPPIPEEWLERQASWEAELERRERESDERRKRAYEASVRAAYADSDAPPLASDAVIRLTGVSREGAPGHVGQLLAAQLTQSRALSEGDMLKLIRMREIPLDAIVTGMCGTACPDSYQVDYTDQQGQRHTIDLGADRVIAEWAEGILAERRWSASPSARRWKHPRPSDIE